MLMARASVLNKSIDETLDETATSLICSRVLGVDDCNSLLSTLLNLYLYI
jgi:hypothetical protein